MFKYGLVMEITIFVVENNKWVIIWLMIELLVILKSGEKLAFGMHGEEVDGMDVLAVRGAAQSIERARAGEGPTL